MRQRCRSLQDRKGTDSLIQVLLLKHPGDKIRDTSKYGPLRELAGSKRPALRTLAKKALGIDIQEGEHSSVSAQEVA